MKYLFTLLSVCFVLGLSAQTSSEASSKLINDQIEKVKEGLASQNAILLKNSELTADDKISLTDKLTLTEDQIFTIKKALVENGNAIEVLKNSDIAPLEKAERMSGLEAQRDHLIYQELTPQQQTAIKKARGLN